MKNKRFKCPEYYAAPLRSKTEIIEYLKSEKYWSVRYYRGVFLFCFNVKVYQIDFSFDNLLKILANVECDFDKQKQNDSTWLAAARAVYDEQFKQDYVLENVLNDMCDDVFNTDTYHTLWDGTQVDVDFEFNGRSGGWLCISEFEGLPVRGTWEEFDEADYAKLLKLYKFIQQCSHDFSCEMVTKEVHYQAAYRLANLFEINDVQTLEQITAASLGSGI